MSIEAIKDKYERPILSLRITITNKCNENCLYCHHDGMDDSQEEMNADEIYRICEIAKNIGVRKIRLSGGEPLIRKDIVEIVSKIASLDFDDISITSNGTLLGKYAKDLKEVDDMFEFCKKHGIILQLIELMDSENCDDEKFSKDYHYNLDPINEKLLSICDEVKTREFMQNRKKYFIDGGEIEVVKPIENSDFCANCTRLRITPDGKIKPCLLRNDNLVELISHIRNNESDSQLKEVFIKGINKREPYNN